MKETIVQILSFLSIAIGIIKKFEPGVDSYLKKGAPVLAEVDDIIDVVAAEFPNNQYLQTASDISDRVLAELQEAGYKLKPEDLKKIDNRVKAKISRKEGLDVDLDFKEKKLI